MGSREDDDWFNVKYAEASCYEHGAGDHMYFDAEASEWFCEECDHDDEMNRVYRYG